MTAIILKPDPQAIATWGTLAHVSAEERDRILKLPVWQRQQAITRIATEVLKRKRGTRG